VATDLQHRQDPLECPRTACQCSDGNSGHGPGALSLPPKAAAESGAYDSSTGKDFVELTRNRAALTRPRAGKIRLICSRMAKAIVPCRPAGRGNTHWITSVAIIFSVPSDVVPTNRSIAL